MGSFSRPDSPDRRDGKKDYRAGWGGESLAGPAKTEDPFMESRRKKREEIQGESVRGVWARSPSPPKWSLKDLAAARTGDPNHDSYYSAYRYKDDFGRPTNLPNENGHRSRHMAEEQSHRKRPSSEKRRRSPTDSESSSEFDSDPKSRKVEKHRSEKRKQKEDHDDEQAPPKRVSVEETRDKDVETEQLKEAKAMGSDSDSLKSKDRRKKESSQRKGASDSESSGESDGGSISSSGRDRKRKSRKQKSKDKSKSLHKKRRHSLSASEKSASESEEEVGDDEWVEKEVVITKRGGDDDVVGPLPPSSAPSVVALDRDRKANRAMLPGEASAMAAFIEEGVRIPRRGEIGLDPEEIESYEKAGFVMSGSRHRRMEAVRLRKEAQMYTADERRALAMFNYEEKMKREKELMATLREQLQEKQRRSDLKKQ